MFDKKDFHEKVLIILSRIPIGSVTTYGLIAEKAGAKSSSRQVGYILSTLKNNNLYPCHRVVNRNGLLTGKFNFKENEMEKLLKAEGIEIIEDKVVNLKEKLWIPNL